MKKIYSVILFVAAVLLSGCNFLDHEPDMRSTIDTKKKVQLLLVSAYPTGNAMPLAEFSSDNIIDNNAPDEVGHQKHLTPLDRMYDEIFAWEPVTLSGEQDSPKYVWEACYMAAAAANKALQAIEELEATGEDMSAERGEALLCRAYAHFLLVGLFCHTYKNEELSSNDLGLAYAIEPETSVSPEYHRESVTQTYKHIQDDLEEGLKLVTDDYYQISKYHFNVRAAHAFAARFYLYKREWAKVVEHANYVLGTTAAEASALMFDNYYAHYVCTDATTESYAWWDAQSPSNLLLYTTYSQVPYTNIPSYGRYQWAGSGLNYTFLGEGPCWGTRDLVGSVSLWSYGSDQYGSFLAKALWMFEYTDKVNGYGYIHAMTRAFTCNELLLSRAEAKVHLNDLDGAREDFRVWISSYNVNEKPFGNKLDDGSTELTDAQIRRFYTKSRHDAYAPTLHNQDISPDFVISDNQLPYVWCALHFRRLETAQDGLRWHDIKRYGIEITHQQGTLPLNTLTWDDDRRALQLPQEVILKGLEANPRQKVGSNAGADASALASVGISDNELVAAAVGLSATKATVED